MTVAYEMSESDLIADLEDRILQYLRDQETNSAAARTLVEAIRQQQAFLSTAPIVTAIWDLNAKSKIRVDSDWNVTLREDRQNTSSSAPQPA